MVRHAGARLVVVHLPSGNSSLRKIERDLASGRDIMQFLGRHAMLGDVPMLDVAEHFARLSLQELRAVYSVGQHHMSPQGNRLVAQLLDQWLPTIDPGYPR